MKRTGYLFEEAFSDEVLLHAFNQAARGKRKGFPCYDFERRLASNLQELKEELWSGTYRPRPYKKFNVFEPKERTIYAPAFRDVVVQHAIYCTIYSLFDSSFIDHSFACRKGKGIHAASNYAQRALRATKDTYVLKLDIEKFFYSIDREILKNLLRKKIKDKRFLSVMFMFLDYGDHSVSGIPIGNLLSQIYANIYMNKLDHYVKRVLKVSWYCRYVDDFVLFGLTLEQAKEHQKQLELFVNDEMNMKLSHWSISPSRKGVDFVGYRTWSSRRFVRKHSLYTLKRAAKQGKLNPIVSSLGHAKYTSSLSHMLTILKEQHHDLYLQVPKTYYPNPNNNPSVS